MGLGTEYSLRESLSGATGSLPKGLDLLARLLDYWLDLLAETTSYWLG